MWSKYSRYFLVDDPVPYWPKAMPDKEKTKENALYIYPAIMKQYVDFYIVSSCLTLDKNTSGKTPQETMKIIPMSYLEYLYYVSNAEKPYTAFVAEMLKMLTHNPTLVVNFGYNENKRGILQIGSLIYSSEDFDEIKTIICEQNLLELPDESIQKEIRDKLKEAEELRHRGDSNKMAGLEEQIACVIISSGLSLDDIYKMPIRKFSYVLQRADMKLHYQIYLSASMSGMVEFKDKSFIKHWMTEKEKDKFGGNAMELDSVKSKIDMSDLKK